MARRAWKLLSLLLVVAVLATALTGCARPEIPGLDGDGGGGQVDVTDAPPPPPEIGDERAEDHDLSGTVELEKAAEGQMFSAIGFLSAAAAPSVSGVGVPITVGAAGFSALASALEKYGTWDNWPMGRYDFDYISPPWWQPLDNISAAVGNSITNLLFTATKALTRVSINLMLAAFHTNITVGLADWIGAGVARIFSFTGQPFMLVMLKLAIVAFLLYSAYKILRGRLASAFTSLVVAAVAVGGILWFAPNAGYVVRTVGEFTDGLAGVALSAVGNFTAAGQSMDESISPLDRGLIVAANGVWTTIVAKPWAVMVFGTADPEKLEITGPGDVGPDEVSEYEILEGRRGDFPADSFDKVRRDMRADTLYLATAPGTPAREAVLYALGSGRYDPNILAGETAVGHGEHPGSVTGLSPGGTWSKIPTAFLTFVAALAFTFLVVVVGGSILVCQFVLAVLIIMLPLFLLALLVPDTGYAVAMKYGRTLLGYLAVKLLYGIYLALVLALALAV